ncbi:hypothetical protein PRIC1_014674 [Phytophthora ramorum]|uniref:RxLR effector protein Avh23 n=1 Tax=Phytophthora ramorum TaxID=164328 RepID=UPI003096B825|nr:RxLR effector protein Avh23 [Phytophthora ramorum]KAH7496149.1 RxLR effector protein Avh23 [Phytophthora ramorum]
MRLTCILAVVIAATLHASGNAISTTKDSNHVAIPNVASSDIARSLEDNTGRHLRRVDNEERTFKEFGGALKKFLEKRTPFTDAWKQRRADKFKLKAKKRYDRMQSNILYAST